MDAAATIREYYDALRDGAPLGPFFAEGERSSDGGGDGEEDCLVKFGISERLRGDAAITAGLREQTATTTDWVVESRDLCVSERACHAWFADEVFLGWTDTDRAIRFEFETRWSGTLEALDGDTVTGPADDSEQGENWQFVGMHVSTAEAL